MQGGPLMHVIAAKAVAFKEALRAGVQDLSETGASPTRSAMAGVFAERGVKVVSGGTDNHLMLLDLIGKEYTGKDADAALGRAVHHRQQKLGAE